MSQSQQEISNQQLDDLFQAEQHGNFAMQQEPSQSHYIYMHPLSKTEKHIPQQNQRSECNSPPKNMKISRSTNFMSAFISNSGDSLIAINQQELFREKLDYQKRFYTNLQKKIRQQTNENNRLKGTIAGLQETVADLKEKLKSSQFQLQRQRNQNQTNTQKILDAQQLSDKRLSQLACLQEKYGAELDKKNTLQAKVQALIEEIDKVKNQLITQQARQSQLQGKYTAQLSLNLKMQADKAALHEQIGSLREKLIGVQEKRKIQVICAKEQRKDQLNHLGQANRQLEKQLSLTNEKWNQAEQQIILQAQQLLKNGNKANQLNHQLQLKKGELRKCYRFIQRHESSIKLNCINSMNYMSQTQDLSRSQEQMPEIVSQAPFFSQ